MLIVALIFSHAAQSLENPDSMLFFYILLRGVQKFQSEFNSYPGEFVDHVEPDIVKLKVSWMNLRISNGTLQYDINIFRHALSSYLVNGDAAHYRRTTTFTKFAVAVVASYIRYPHFWVVSPRKRRSSS